jgi:Xaa-Pro dipeptidase
MVTTVQFAPREIVSPFAFPEPEHRARVARARRLMDEYHLDGLLITDDRNSMYFTGAGLALPRDDRARPSFLLIGRTGEVAAVVSHTRCVVFRESSWVPDLRPYAVLDLEGVRSALADAIADVFRGATAVGMELGFEQRLAISVTEFEWLRGRFPHIAFRDASALLWRLRAIKSDAEIDRLARAGEITTEAYAAVFRELAPGMTERAIATRLHAEMGERGAHATWVWVLSGQYDRGGMLLRDRVVQAGDMVWADMGASFRGYYSDFSRAAVLGRATPAQLATQAKIADVTRIGMEALRPGVRVADVAGRCDREMEKRGLTFSLGVRYGHGMGLAATEPPHIGTYDATVVSAAMVLTMEPGTWTSEGRFHIEENFVVTESGPRRLSLAPWQLYEVGRE